MLDYSIKHRGWAELAQKNRRVLRVGGGGDRASAGRSATPTSRSRRRRRRAAGWWNWKPAAHALDYLWMSGRTLVHSRRALPEALRPRRARAAGRSRGSRRSSAAEFRRWHLRRSLRAMGAATETDLRMYLTLPAHRRPPSGGARCARRSTSGEVVEIAVAGAAARWYALAADLPALGARPARRMPAPRHDAPLALRLVPLAPRAHAPPLRLRLSHRGLHAGPRARATATTRCRSSTTAS